MTRTNENRGRRMNVRVKAQDTILFEGTLPEIPRVGDLVAAADERRRVESVTWELASPDAPPDATTVTVVLDDMPYGY